MLGISQKMLDGVSVLGESVTTPPAFTAVGIEDTTHTIKWGEGVSSGEVVVEFADDYDYTGTWNTLATVTFDGSVGAPPREEYVRVQGAYGAIRHRISDEVLDGTVSSTIRGTVDD